MENQVTVQKEDKREASMEAVLRRAAAEYETPAYVFDVDGFQERLREIREIVGEKIGLCYSIKANSWLTKAASEVWDHLEVCSPGELEICRAVGVPAEKILYSGVVKGLADTREAIRIGAGTLTAESLGQLALVEKAAAVEGKKVDVLLRLNAGSQFGMSREDLLMAVREREQYPHVNLVGIHFFAGTQQKKTARQEKDLAMLLEMMEEIQDQFDFRMRRLEYGPGFCVPLFEGEDFTDTLAPLKNLAPALQRAAEQVELTIEMGRFAATECGTYLTKIVDLKENAGTRYALIDGGINHVNYYGQIMGMKVPVVTNLGKVESRDPELTHSRTSDGENEREDENHHPNTTFISEHRNSSDGACRSENASSSGVIINEDRKDTAEEREEKQNTSITAEYCLCGSLCTTGDVITRQLPLESPEVGDVIALHNIGAYSVTEGIYLFLSRTMPRILLHSARDGLREARGPVEIWKLNCAAGRQEKGSVLQ